MPLLLIRSHNGGKDAGFSVTCWLFSHQTCDPYSTEKEAEAPCGVGVRHGQGTQSSARQLPTWIKTVTGPYSQCPCSKEALGTEKVAIGHRGSWRVSKSRTWKLKPSQLGCVHQPGTHPVSMAQKGSYAVSAYLPWYS